MIKMIGHGTMITLLENGNEITTEKYCFEENAIFAVKSSLI